MPQPNWERVSTNNGYIVVHCPDHPKANPCGYVFVHRITVERHIGRFLSSNEIVHHKDENKTNNNIANLEVLTRSQHSTHHGAKRTRAMLSLICPQCSIGFTREKRQTHFDHRTTQPFCSRRCATLFHHQRRHA